MMGAIASARSSRKWLVWLLGSIVVSLAGGQSRAQTVGPVIVEYKEKAKGRFEITNNTTFPLYVVLEPKSFDLSETGEVKYRPLDGGTDLRLSEMSFRIPPQATHYVFYEATAAKLPAWFTIFSNIGGLPSKSGLTVRLMLPHTVYLLQKQKFSKADVQVRVAEFQPQSKRVTIEVRNTSPYLGRALAVEVRAGKKEKASAGGFPLLPKSQRQVLVPWSGSVLPESVAIRFEGFAIQAPVSDAGKPDMGTNHD